MLPDQSAFISYKSVRNLRVCMGNNSYAPLLGQGTAIISLNGQHLLIRDILHIPAPWVPLYSLCTHIRQPGCGFLGSYKMGFHVYLPRVVLSVNTSTDCHLSYVPLGKFTPLPTLHYVQPQCAPTTYPTEHSALCANTGSATPPSLLVPAPPAIIKDDSSTSFPLALPSFVLSPVAPGSDTHKHLPTFTPLSRKVPLNLVLHLPLRLSLHPPGC
jgi:hypothetical protein